MSLFLQFETPVAMLLKQIKLTIKYKQFIEIQLKTTYKGITLSNQNSKVRVAKDYSHI